MLDESATVTLPGAAGHSSVTVPVTEPSPTTGFGLRVSDVSPIGRTLIVTLLVIPPKLALTVPVWSAVTAGAIYRSDWSLDPGLIRSVIRT